MARSASGEARVFSFLAAEAGPFAQREDCDLVVRGLVELMAMPSAGDLVIYGTGAADGNISFIPERGAHAGPTSEELHTFIAHPEAVSSPHCDHTSASALRSLHSGTRAVETLRDNALRKYPSIRPVSEALITSMAANLLLRADQVIE